VKSEERVDLGRIVGLVGDSFDERGSQWALCRGLALAGYGLGRTTFDADFVVDGAAEDALTVFLESNGFQTL
jgi:hypothetical protein